MVKFTGRVKRVGPYRKHGRECETYGVAVVAWDGPRDVAAPTGHIASDDCEILVQLDQAVMFGASYIFGVEYLPFVDQGPRGQNHFPNWMAVAVQMQPAAKAA